MINVNQSKKNCGKCFPPFPCALTLTVPKFLCATYVTTSMLIWNIHDFRASKMARNVFWTIFKYSIKYKNTVFFSNPIKKLFFPQKKLPSIFSAQIIVGFLILLHCNLIERRAQRRLDSLDYFPAQLATIVWFIIFHFFKARPLCFLAEHNTWDIQLQHNSQN